MDLKTDIFRAGKKSKPHDYIMLTPSDLENGIVFDSKISTLVESIERIKPTKYQTDVLEKNKQNDILLKIDINKLDAVKNKGKKNNVKPYTKVELVTIAQGLNIAGAQKMQKEEIVDAIKNFTSEGITDDF